jgi:hypothetical protein
MNTKIISFTFVLVYPGAVYCIPELLDVAQESSFKLLALKPFTLSKEVAGKIFNGEHLEDYMENVKKTEDLLMPEDRNFYSSVSPAMALIFGHPSHEAISIFENLTNSIKEGKISTKLRMVQSPFLYCSHTIDDAFEMTNKLFPNFELSSFNYKD